MFCFFFFFNDTATTEIYTLSLHDALPISIKFTPEGGRIELAARQLDDHVRVEVRDNGPGIQPEQQQRIFEAFFRLTETDRKSTRLNSSHGYISYAVFCLKKKICIHRNRTV